VVSTGETHEWANRALCALGKQASLKLDASRTALPQAMAAQFASRFEDDARLHEAG